MGPFVLHQDATCKIGDLSPGDRDGSCTMKFGEHLCEVVKKHKSAVLAFMSPDHVLPYGCRKGGSTTVTLVSCWLVLIQTVQTSQCWQPPHFPFEDPLGNDNIKVGLNLMYATIISK